ncbi:PAS domain S-box-containing protein/diguanylate cyclase (GGDEF)-like protein [Luteimonas cucumeris]|uniref:PAS domain S-box-containing protein/diguanylate cyclase (GGDEF)-like protein n=1 Tax=Luteimonas cucumeris TaxID=985012 RepID=A0A562L7C5_9GAMM|nr:EAL domain-containing protein [Luteimonas cucumeris]TWI03572.1 PAS domain S-box-containing protein/diguanylate cyclase (GGDEF)-like protein [Luteimonas cucumeris]
MQTGRETTVRLLVVDDSVEDAEAIVSGLRNGGLAVRPSRPENAAQLAAMVGSQPLDLVLAAKTAQQVSAAETMAILDASGKDLPLILLLDKLDDTALLDAVALGARNVALRGRIDHVQTVVRSEFTDLEARRGLRRLEAQMRETERRCDALITSSRDPIAYVHEGMHIRANDAYLEMFGFESFDDIEGMSLLDLVAPAHVDSFKQLLKGMSKGEAPPPRYDLEARGLDGNTFPALMEFTAATYDDESCLQIVLRRQETDPALAREVEELRRRDQVTGLLNRQTFLHALESAVSEAAQNGANHGLLLIEPDHHQQLLQEIGLDAADALAAALAQRLQPLLGEDDEASRFGEYSFAVLARDSDHARTAQLAENIRAGLAKAVIEAGARSLSMTVSIGGVQISERNASLAPILARASEGLQSALGVGGNRVELYDPGALDRAEEERIEAWVSRLRKAIDEDGFLLHYQPVISLQGEPGAMYECFLRLDGGDGELVQPQAFLPIAEEHGLIAEIDRWVVKRAIRIIGERSRAGKPVQLLVKITQASLGDNVLLDLISEQLASQRAAGECLILQLPESKVFTHLKAAQAFLVGAAKLGCRVGLEQFGSGLNSIQLLAHFKPHFVKIDRGFMQDLSKNDEQQVRVREIAKIAREGDIRSIAEFVQDAASMTFLFSSGVDYVQGHFLAMAGPDMNYEFE